MFNWFKQHFSREAIENSTPLRRIKKYFTLPELWIYNRETVARGVAIGLFTALIPIMPFQMLLAALLAIGLRANLVISIAVCWINNPITIIPITYFTRDTGKLVLGEQQSKFQYIMHEIALKLGLANKSFFSTWIVPFSKEYFTGLLILAVSAAILGYLLVILFWYIYHFFKK